MASATPSVSVEQEAICPICLEWLTEPVTLDCGHNLCRRCNIKYTEKWEHLGDLECPVCKARIQKGAIRPNWQLASILERIRFLPLKGESDSCLKHKEKLNLFCKEDRELVCVRCERSPEHRSHTMLLPEEAAEECKERLMNNLQSMKKEKEEVMTYKADTGKEYRYLLRQTDKEKQKTMAEFRQLHQFLEVQEKFLLSQMEEVEKEIVSKRDKYMSKISKELQYIESLIREAEETCQQSTFRFLQDIKQTLQRFEEKEKFESEVIFPPELKLKIWEFCDINPYLGTIMNEFKENLVSRDQLSKKQRSPSSYHVVNWKRDGYENK